MNRLFFALSLARVDALSRLKVPTLSLNKIVILSLVGVDTLSMSLILSIFLKKKILKKSRKTLDKNLVFDIL
jgi:hypothetical protein